MLLIATNGSRHVFGTNLPGFCVQHTSHMFVYLNATSVSTFFTLMIDIINCLIWFFLSIFRNICDETRLSHNLPHCTSDFTTHVSCGFFFWLACTYEYWMHCGHVNHYRRTCGMVHIGNICRPIDGRTICWCEINTKSKCVAADAKAAHPIFTFLKVKILSVVWRPSSIRRCIPVFDWWA